MPDNGDCLKEYSTIKKALLRELSEDSRASITTLAKKLRCSRNTVISNMNALEKEFGIYYTIEFANDKIGTVQNHIWTVKFGIKPRLEDLKKMFEHDTTVRFVARTEGDFDLFIRMLSESDDIHSYWALSTANKLLPYRPVIKPSVSVLTHIGYMPIVNSVVRELDLTAMGMDKLDKEIIMLLNDDSRMTYSAMSKKLGQPIEVIRYRMRKIMKSKMIKRFTIALTKPPTEYNMAFFINYEYVPGIFQRHTKANQYYQEIDEKLPIINTFQFLSLMSGSSMGFGIGCFENEEDAIRKAIIKQKELYREDNPNITFAKITDVIKGYLPVRNIDMKKEFNYIDLKRIGVK